ncbi:MAG TPA: tRNA (guanosine(37)-N1)-methyltransferase TrmD [Bacteroidia bacterium]|nr:tRNA (guanosine(37)-N1)-methyltransferase TrmD [Bacteroidia bacterium]
MLHIDIITVLPELLEGPFAHSIVNRAIDKQLVEISVINLRDYAFNKHRSVDDYMYGGGAGMVMMIEPVHKCLEDLKSRREYDEIIYLSPDGQLLDQQLSNKLSLNKNLVLLCGHYKGIDERIREHLVTLEISIGNYVLSGGELAAAVLTDSLVRLLPGSISDETSALSDSFQDHLIAPPVYTRPAIYNDWKVPEILLSGDEKRIAEWRHQMSVSRTRERRPGMLSGDH